VAAERKSPEELKDQLELVSQALEQQLHLAWLVGFMIVAVGRLLSAPVRPAL